MIVRHKMRIDLKGKRIYVTYSDLMASGKTSTVMMSCCNEYHFNCDNCYYKQFFDIEERATDYRDLRNPKKECDVKYHNYELFDELGFNPEDYKDILYIEINPMDIHISKAFLSFEDGDTVKSISNKIGLSVTQTCLCITVLQQREYLRKVFLRKNYIVYKLTKKGRDTKRDIETYLSKDIENTVFSV